MESKECGLRYDILQLVAFLNFTQHKLLSHEWYEWFMLQFLIILINREWTGPSSNECVYLTEM